MSVCVLVFHTDHGSLQHSSFRGWPNTVRTLLESSGFIINEEESICEPSQQVEFFGFIINSLSMSFSVPASKNESLRALCEKMLKNSYSTLKAFSVDWRPC